MVVTTNAWPLLGRGDTSKYSVTFAFSLYGTPFFRRYPARMFVVTTVSDPARGPAPPGLPRPPRSHWAADWPCQVGGPADAAGGPNRNRRVCMPASVSTFSVLSSCHVMW